MRGSAYAAAQPTGETHRIERLELDNATFNRRGSYEGLKSKQNARPDVTEARVVVSGGRAFKNAEVPLQASKQ